MHVYIIGYILREAERLQYYNISVNIRLYKKAEQKKFNLMKSFPNQEKIYFSK